LFLKKCQISRYGEVMNIAIDVRSILKKEKTGIGYYTFNLINALAKIDRNNDYALYSKIRFFSRDKKPPALPGENFRHKIDRFNLGPPVVLKNTDIFHTSAYDLKPPKGAKFVITVHDIIPKVFPQGHPKDVLEKLDNLLKSVLAAADVILADTKCTANDLKRHYSGQTGQKIKVLYPGVGDEFCVLPQEAKNLYKETLLKYNIYTNYIIYIGTIEPRKNINGLIKAYKALKSGHNIKQTLVITGMKGWMYDDVFKLTEELGFKKDIVFTGYVPCEDLKVLYNFADVSVYPSFYEGAGLPILEAFKCGCPVVTSNVSSMSELAGDAAVLTDPYKIDSIADGIYSVLSDVGLRNSLAQKGLKRAAEFSWDMTAKNLLEIFKGF